MYALDLSTFERKVYTAVDVHGRRILLRTCLNVVTDSEGQMIDATRYYESLPLIRELAHKAEVLLITAHLGRPKHAESQYSFNYIAEQLGRDIEKTVHFITDLSELQHLTAGVYFLENVRFFEGEESNEPNERRIFAHQLTAGMDMFINDAFADYRESASTYDVAEILPSYLGPVFAKEISELSTLTHAQHPFVAILWWAKLSEKLDALLALLAIADKVLVWWAMRYTLLHALGHKVGNCRVEENKLEAARDIVTNYADKLILPLDHMIVHDFADPAVIGYKYTDGQDIPEGHEAIDIGPQGIAQFSEVIAQAKTIIWNGPVGVFEWDTSAHGTKEIGKAIAANTSAYKIIWWGDSIAAVNALGLTWFNHICTWWGAMLAYLAYENLPVLDVILKQGT